MRKVGEVEVGSIIVESSRSLSVFFLFCFLFLFTSFLPILLANSVSLSFLLSLVLTLQMPQEPALFFSFLPSLFCTNLERELSKS